MTTSQHGSAELLTEVFAGILSAAFKNEGKERGRS